MKIKLVNGEWYGSSYNKILKIKQFEVLFWRDAKFDVTAFDIKVVSMLPFR